MRCGLRRGGKPAGRDLYRRDWKALENPKGTRKIVCLFVFAHRFHPERLIP
ncbi:hypothetical protein BSU04_46570 [Caballeronia sordidicola]|uniref:Uncharacterized protein n=1 Tax=Caballeronia sordidicola TaxID=196367 RepID=A0A226WJV3_CABSO|nr:hypothetical protein BSU04_46570 [Caballeronia sordidicola]